VVVRKWRGKADGPGGNTVCLTTALGAKPLQPFDDDDERSRMATCGIKEAKHQGTRGQPPHNTGRAVRGHVMGTLRRVALATAYRQPCEREATGGEPIGWPRWRRPRPEQTRDQGIGVAQGDSGIFHLAEDSWRRGVKLNHVPPAVGSRHQVLANYRLPARHYPLGWNFRHWGAEIRI
jgi:hypothetical protein